MAAISWKSGVGGDWATAGDWSTGSVPGAGDDVTIGAAGTYTVTISEAQAAKSLTLKAAGATVADNSTLTMSGALAVTAGIFQLNGGGLINGGTLSASGGAFAWNNGTISGVTYRGSLDMSASNALLRIGAGGLTATGSAGTGPGAINLTGNSSELIVVNNQTIDNATISFGGASSYAYIFDYDTNGASHTLTFGTGLTINQTGAFGQLGDYAGQVGDGFVNQGKISAGVSGGQFLINTQSFVNQGTIAVSNGDTLTINGVNWSSTGAITANSGTIRLNGAFASSSLAKLTNTSGQVIIGGTLTNGGGPLLVGTGTKAGQLTLAGLITGGTIKDSGGGFVWSNGTLDGVTYDGTLDMSAQNSVLRIGLDGLTAKNTAGTGAGTINVTGNSSELIVVNNQTLNNMTINIGGASAYAYLFDYDTNGTSHTLTFGSGLTINHAGTYAQLTDYAGQAGDGFVNQGKIVAAVNGGQFSINSQSFVNQGTIAVSNGDTLTINAPNWSSTGAITANSGTIRLNGAFASSSLAKLTNTNGQVIIGGTLTNGGGPLSVGTGTKAGQLTLAGLITGGTIKDSGGGFVWNNGTLDGVTYDGTLDMSAQNSVLRIGIDGLTAKNTAGTGAGTINVTGNSSELIVVNNQTLNNATINIGGASAYAYLFDYDTNGTSHTLTFGSGLTINHAGTYAQLTDYAGQAGDGFVNQGKIVAAVNGGQFSINSQSFVNQGTIAVSNGDTLTINAPNWSGAGAITANSGTIRLNGAFASSSLAKLTNTNGQVIIGGTMTNGGGPLLVGTGTKAGQLTLAGLITGGTIKDSGGGFVWSNGTLDGVTYDGTLDMSAQNSVLRIGADGLTAKNFAGKGAGAINVTGNGSELIVVNNQTIDKTTIDLGGASSYAYIFDYDTNGTSHTLTFGSGVTINQTGTYAQMGDYAGQAGDGFVNKGAINATLAGGRLYIGSNTFDNLGSIKVANGDALVLTPGTLTNFSAGTLTAGTFEADVSSTFQLSNNTLISTLDATVILNGAGSTLQSLNTTTGVQAAIDSTLTTIGKAGTLELLGNRDWTSSQALASAGSVVLGGGTFKTTSLTNTGTLSGYGVLATTLTNHGVVATAAGKSFSLVGGKLTNLAGTTLTGGQYIVGTNGTLELANNVQVTTDSALIALNGASATMQSFNTSTKAQVSLDSTLTTITASGTLELLGGRGWSSTKAMTNAGALTLGGGTFAPASLTSTGTVSGYGVIATAFTNNGALAVTAAQTLSLVGGSLTNLGKSTLTGGSYSVGASGTLQLANNNTINTLNAMVTLYKGAVIQSLNTTTSAQVDLEASLTTIGASGVLKVLAGRGYSTTNAITNSGVLNLGGGTFKSGKLTELAGSTLTGFGTVTAAVANAGAMVATGGTLAFGGAVTGAGSVTINGGTASFASTFIEAVKFGASGTLTLAHSLAYSGKISGFSLTGATSLDLQDVGFVSASEARFSGTASGGVLTVSDGTHTAKINLVGDYTGSTFTASSDGSGGVMVVDPPKTPDAPAAVASPPAFVAAMATIAPTRAAITAPHDGGLRGGIAGISLPRVSQA